MADKESEKGIRQNCRQYPVMDKALKEEDTLDIDLADTDDISYILCRGVLRRTIVLFKVFMNFVARMSFRKSDSQIF